MVRRCGYGAGGSGPVSQSPKKQDKTVFIGALPPMATFLPER